MSGVRRRGLAAGALVVLLAAAAAIWSSREAPRERGELRASVSVAESLTADEGAGFARAAEPRALEFPSDHGPHLDRGFESWYFTGQVATESERRFAFHLAFFRVSLYPAGSGAPQRASRWAARAVYRAEFALSDPEDGRFHSTEQLARDALGLGGAEASPMRVWVYDWYVEAEAGGGARQGFTLHATYEEAGIDLRVEPVKPALAWSETLFSGASGPPPLHAYSLPRMRVAGTVRTGADAHRVEGTGWLDHLWRGSGGLAGLTARGVAGFLSEGQVAWNRFAVQLDDGRELLCLQLHRRDGSGEPIPTGVMISAEGASRRLTRNDLELSAYRTWESPANETAYPAGWRIRVPDQHLALELTPMLDDQEIRLSARYWAGALRVTGQAKGSPVSGQAHAVLTGYAGDDER